MKPADSIGTDFPCSLYVLPAHSPSKRPLTTPRRIIRIPFPSPRLAIIALRALAADQELSPLVRRFFSLDSIASTPAPITDASPAPPTNDLNPSPRTGGALLLGPGTHAFGPPQPASSVSDAKTPVDGGEDSVLVTHYSATTNRMLRVAVNGFFESVGVVIACMRELDVDVVSDEWIGDGDDEVDQLNRVQGLEEGGTVG